jgi:hypothetical protein
VQPQANALGGERDGSQGILDLVRDALGHFSPGGGLLGLEQITHVLKDDDEPSVRIAAGLGRRLAGKSGNRDGQVHQAAVNFRLEWPGGLAQTGGALEKVAQLAGVIL